VRSISLSTAPPPRLVAHHLLDADGERVRIPGSNKTLRRKQFGHAADIRGDGGQASRHRFEQRPREALGEGWQDEQMRRVERRTNACTILLSNELDHRRKPQGLALSLVVGEQPTVANDAELYLGTLSTKLVDGVEKDSSSFVRLIQSSNRDQHELRRRAPLVPVCGCERQIVQRGVRSGVGLPPAWIATLKHGVGHIQNRNRLTRELPLRRPGNPSDRHPEGMMKGTL
jgi:hypothetical protein